MTPSSRTELDPDFAAAAPLWRAAQVFRLITLLYAIGQQVASVQYYTREGLSWALIGVMVLWSIVSSTLLSQWLIRNTPRIRTAVVIGDQVVVIALMCATRLVADFDWYHGHQTLPTTLWASNAVMSAAILWGPLGGIGSGLLISVVATTVRAQWDVEVWKDATTPVLISVGLAIGLAANTARRAQQQLQEAVRLNAAMQERERLSREVHDGVLQVLSYIKRRGSEIGGATAELAQRAGEQEVALRVLISEQVVRPDTGGAEEDLRPLLTAQATPSVFVSTPGDPVMLGRWTAREIAAAVGAALSNVVQHAGSGAKAYVLVEDTGDAVIVSVRDDGPGIPVGRLAAAEAEGRMGVSRSIIGRIAALGGRAELLTDDETGTEWEFRVPRHNRK
ncbi:MacS family sensor histidine kinase [Nocardia sp. NPDC050406]|uniref:MacS family sensor histidine kinase n=1 Tax=Nocardia sp. NPDC050406 TaxID=3364318 RepID=UPI0037A1BFBD